MASLLRELPSLVQRAFLVLAGELFPFLTNGRARALPPMPTIVVVVAAGLLVPFVVRVDARSSSIAASLATQRLVRFEQEAKGTLPALAPTGPILYGRPSFRWPAIESAARYGFRLYSGEALWIGTDMLREPRYRMLPPGLLEGGPGDGRPYRFEVRAFDASGRALAWGSQERLEGTFTLRAMSEADAKDLAATRLDLAPAEADFVRAGLCAEKGAAADVAACLEGYLDLGPEDEAGRALAERLLKQLGWR